VIFYNKFILFRFHSIGVNYYFLNLLF